VSRILRIDHTVADRFVIQDESRVTLTIHLLSSVLACSLLFADGLSHKYRNRTHSLVPDNCALSLVCDANACQVSSSDIRTRQRTRHTFLHLLPDLCYAVQSSVYVQQTSVTVFTVVRVSGSCLCQSQDILCSTCIVDTQAGSSTHSGHPFTRIAQSKQASSFMWG
jgi:hypothetical protein